MEAAAAQGDTNVSGETALNLQQQACYGETETVYAHAAARNTGKGTKKAAKGPKQTTSDDGSKLKAAWDGVATVTLWRLCKQRLRSNNVIQRSHWSYEQIAERLNNELNEQAGGECNYSYSGKQCKEKWDNSKSAAKKALAVCRKPGVTGAPASAEECSNFLDEQRAQQEMRYLPQWLELFYDSAAYGLGLVDDTLDKQATTTTLCQDEDDAGEQLLRIARAGCAAKLAQRSGARADHVQASADFSSALPLHTQRCHELHMQHVEATIASQNELQSLQRRVVALEAAVQQQHKVNRRQHFITLDAERDILDDLDAACDRMTALEAAMFKADHRHAQQGAVLLQRMQAVQALLANRAESAPAAEQLLLVPPVTGKQASMADVIVPGLDYATQSLLQVRAQELLQREAALQAREAALEERELQLSAREQAAAKRLRVDSP